MKKCLLLLAFLGFSVIAEAATYNLPSNRPAGCSANGQTVTCSGNLNMSWNDVINVTGTVVLNITGNANFENTKINQSGSASALTINIGGNLGSNSDFRANANFDINGNANFGSANIINGNISADDINTSSNSNFTGNLSADGEINTASANTINGTLQATDIYTGSSNTITGNLIADYVETGSANIIQGNISADEIYIRSSSTQVTGNLSAVEDIYIGSQAVINGSVTSGDDIDTNSPVTINGAVTAADEFSLASGSTVTGPVNATDVTMEASNARINGDITVSDTLTVESGGIVVGSVTAENVILENGNSTIEGDVDAEEDVEVGYGGQIIGNVSATTVDNNGTIQGDVNADHIENDGAISGGTNCDTSSGSSAVNCSASGSTNYLFWRFNETSWNGTAGEVLDVSTFNRHGRARNSASVLTASPAIAGNPGSCGYGSFTGQSSGTNSQYIEVANNATINDATNFSVSFWLNMNSASQPASSNQTIVAYGGATSTTSGRFHIYRRASDGNLVFDVRVQNDSVRRSTVSGSTAFNGSWQYVTATYNYADRKISLFLNGTEVNAVTFSGSRTPKSVTGALGIGALPTGATGMTGLIDELRFYARVLTPSEMNTARTEVATCPGIGLVLGWDLNQGLWSGAANEVIDFSGNNLHGRTYNGVQSLFANTALSGDPGSCSFSQFNGSNQYIETADNNLLDISAALTLGIWVKPASRPASGLMTIVSKDANFELHQQPDGKVQWWWNDSTLTARQLVSSTALTLNQWNHIVIVYNSGSQKIFINGVQDVTSSFSGTLRTNTSPLQLGQDQGFAGRYFNGFLDELRLYDRALSNAQAQALQTERRSCNQCFTENFYTTENWYAAAYAGSEMPTVQTSPQRLRMTRNIIEQSTSMTIRKKFPGIGNKVSVEFNYYAWKPNSGAGADGIAVTLSDANYTPAPGSFGGSLGYAQRTSPNNVGFNGGWIGIGLDEFGNFSNPTEGRLGGPGFRAQAIALRGSQPNYNYLTGATVTPNVDVVNTATPAPGHRYRITVDATTTTPTQRAYVKVERDTTGTGNSYSTIINNYDAAAAAGQQAVPQDFFLSFTGATGASVNNHEIAAIQVCTVQPAPEVIITPPSAVHHYELSYGAQGLTCNPTDVTIKACTDAACTTLYNSSVSLTVAATNGASLVGGNTITFTGSTTKSLQKTSTGDTVLSVTGPSAVPSNALVCKQNGVTDDCALNFADSGFVFDVQNMIANQAQNVQLRAVRKDNSSQQCVPGFAGVTRSIKLWSDYIDPIASGRPESRSVLVNSNAIAQSFATAVGQNLAFNSSGVATIALNYIDAGQMQLNARYDGSGGTGDNGLVMTGSDQFVSRPAGLCIREGNGVVAAQSCSSPFDNCGIYKKAGESFNIAVIAKASANNGDANLCANTESTPNFKLNDIPLSHSLVAPTLGQGGSLGTITMAEHDHIQAANGINTLTQSVSEVGVFSFSTPALSYLGTTVPAATSHAFGRFVPAYFTVTTNTPVLATTCGAFSYLGEELGYSTNPIANFTARNTAGAVTNNYGGAFFRATALAAAATTTNAAYSTTTSPASSIPGATRGTYSVAGQSDYNGIFTLTLDADKVNFNRTKVLPYPAPFTPDLRLSALAGSMADSDAVCIKTTAAGVCEDLVFSTMTVPALRYGRLVLKGGSVAEVSASAANVAVGLNAEYWNGSAFVLNTQDSCTAVNPSLLTSIPPVSPSGAAGTLSNGVNAANSLVAAVPANTDGTWPVFYQAPLWLRFNWISELPPMPAALENPVSEVSVGRYRGNKRQIFWQEKLN